MRHVREDRDETGNNQSSFPTTERSLCTARFGLEAQADIGASEMNWISSQEKQK